MSDVEAASGSAARFELDFALDLPRTLSPLQHSRWDPTIRFEAGAAWLTRRTAHGPATIRVRIEAAPGGAVVDAQAWGPGAADALEAVPALAGALDRPDALVPAHPLVHELARRFPGVRLTRTGQLLPQLVIAVLGQKITGAEMVRAYLGLLRRVGEPAPGPGGAMGLAVWPTARDVAALPYFEFHPIGVERRRAELIARLAAHEAEIEGLMALEPGAARERLLRIPGVGPWTAAEATRLAFGDPDAVSVGDAHIPDMVAWSLAGEPRADDARMLEILAPYAGQRARVVLLLEAAHARAPRFGPRFRPGDIGRL